MASTVCLACPNGLSCFSPDQDPLPCVVSDVQRVRVCMRVCEQMIRHHVLSFTLLFDTHNWKGGTFCIMKILGSKV